MEILSIQPHVWKNGRSMMSVTKYVKSMTKTFLRNLKVSILVVLMLSSLDHFMSERSFST